MLFWTDIIPPVGTPPDDWPSFSWFAVWNQPVGSPCDLTVGGEVILIAESGRATWRTEVTDLALVPFEHVTAGLEELERRWRIRPRWSGPDVSPGMLVAWRARPLGYLDIDGPEPTQSPLACADCGGEGVAQWLRTLPARRAGPSS